ncbi:MAG: hypothetical protein JXR05_04795 [Flavobacteriaceae bacterium]
MKKLSKIFAIVLFISIATSCSNDNNDTIEEVQNVSATLKANLTDYARSAAALNQSDHIFNANNGDCFTINYPYLVTNGQTVTEINNDDELYDYLSNLTTSYFSFVFPLNVTLANGSQHVINNEIELDSLIYDCYNPIGSNLCFSFNYPLCVVDTSGDIFFVNCDCELFSLQNIVDFVYPFTVTTSNGIVTINSSADFDAVYNECFGIDNCTDCVEVCFEIVYPLTLIQDNGTIVTINSDIQFDNYLQSLGSDSFFTVSYPMTVRFEDGTEQVINNDNEFNTLLDSCN